MKDFFENAFADDPKYGGTQIMCYGAKGSGKSMLLSTWALKDLERGHTIIWRGKDVDTWTIFSHRAKVRVIVPNEGYRITREDRDGKEIPLENTEIVVCPRPDDAVSLLKKQSINVLLLESSSTESESLWWTIFARTLNHSSLGWVTLCVDEINDIFESNPRGDLSQIHKKFKDAFASFRKKRIHVRASAHIYHDINYEISYKFKYTVYMKYSSLIMLNNYIQRKFIALNQFINLTEIKIKSNKASHPCQTYSTDYNHAIPNNEFIIHSFP